MCNQRQDHIVLQRFGKLRTVRTIIISLDGTQIHGPYVVISSHLTELARELKGLENMALKCMDIRTDVDGLPVFTYKIQQGVAQEKLGMWLLEKSGLFNAFGKHCS